MRRASTEAKKRERRAAILKKARTYMAGHAFSEIRLADMARELGLVKGTLYLYFPTKQDLFSSILIEEMEAWWASLQATPATTPGADLVEGLASRELLVRLLSSLHMTIEPGLSPDGLRSLKMWFLDFSRRATGDLETRYPSVRGKSYPFLMGVYSLTLGASQLAFPPENVREFVSRERALDCLRIDFRDFLAASIDALYKGYRGVTAMLPSFSKPREKGE